MRISDKNGNQEDSEPTLKSKKARAPARTRAMIPIKAKS
jgi:hypothetical protein